MSAHEPAGRRGRVCRNAAETETHITLPHELVVTQIIKLQLHFLSQQIPCVMMVKHCIGVKRL